MDILKKLDLKKISVPKAIGLLIIGLLILMVVTSLIGFAFRTTFNSGGYGAVSERASYGVPSPSYYDDSMDYAAEESISQKISIRNTTIPPIPGRANTTGNTAENFEVTQFNGNIETGRVVETCGRIEELKLLDYVIFENANKYDRGCDFTFKVENANVSEVLSLIEELKPESLNENTYTLKNLVDDYTSEVEILQKKLASVESTLLDAQASYDEVEVLATKAQDVESLAKIIDSKIDLIERLTSERINIKERIDRINRSKAEQLDRLQFTYFNLRVWESHIVDLEGLKDSWMYEFKQLIQEFSSMLQSLSTGLLMFIFKAIPVAIYLIAALFILKYGWRGAKYMWKK